MLGRVNVGNLISDANRIAKLPQKAVQTASEDLFVGVVEVAEAFTKLLAADMEFDRASAMLLKAKVDFVARGSESNPGREQRDLIVASLKRKEVLLNISARFIVGLTGREG